MFRIRPWGCFRAEGQTPVFWFDAEDCRLQGNTRFEKPSHETIHIVSCGPGPIAQRASVHDFDGLSSSLSAGGYSEGFQFNSVIESADLADNSIYDGYVLNNQARYFVPLKNGHVLAQKLFVGLTVEGNSSFELGGSASEPYIGPGFQFKKRSLALRGYDDNLAELVDKNAASYSLEYRMPFDWLDSASMVPPVGFSGWSVRGFVDNGWLWSSEFDISDVYSGIGAELIMDGSLGYYLNIRLRMGVAKGLHSFGSDSFYVQLGGSF